MTAWHTLDAGGALQKCAILAHELFHTAVICSQGGWIFDVSQRGTIKLAGNFPANDAVDIAASGNIACVSDWTGGHPYPEYGLIRILNFSNPALPFMQGSYDYSWAMSHPNQLSFSGDMLYATSGRGFDVFDISNPATPVEIGRGIDDPYQPSGDITVTGNLAFVTSVYGLHVFDVSNPSNATQVGVIDISGRSVRVFGDVAYVNSGIIDLISVTNPANPIYLTSLPDDCGSASSLSGSVKWFGGKLLDVSVPTAPTILGCLDAVDAEVVGDIAYVANLQGLQVFDIGNPGAPILLDWFNTASPPTTPPMIIAQPQAVTAVSGARITFSVAAVGDAPLLYQWLKDGAVLVNGGRISGVTSTNLTITNFQPSDVGGYSVVVTNVYGTTSSQVATLTLSPDPPSPQTIIDNFTDPTNWGIPTNAPGNNISIGSGRMNYTTTSTSSGGAIIPRNAPLLPTTQDWSLKVDVHVDPFTLATQGQFADVFLGFGKTGDWFNTYVFFEFDRGWWLSSYGYDIGDDVRINGVDAPGLFKVNNLTSPDAALRMDYNAANQTVTYYFDSNGATGGYNWVAQGTANLASGTYNLNLSATDTFTIILAGSSEYQTVAAGQAYLSNLEITINQAATWTYTGSLKTASFSHTTTLLPSGKVLLAGGQTVSGITNRAEVFDPAVGTWTNTGAMTTNRYYHTATLLLNGKVLVAGGFTAINGNVLASTELFDPATGTWTRTGSMTTARGYHVAILLRNGKVLVTGGAGNNFSCFNNAEVYDPSTGIWTPTGTMSSARVGFVGARLSDGKVLVAGGQVVGGASVASAELYDPAAGTWTATGSMTYDRSDFAATLLSNGKVLVTGGWGNASDNLVNTELYDPASGRWTASGSLNTGRFYPSLTLLQNGKVLVTGGFDAVSTFSSAELYDPSVGSWVNTVALNTARRQHTATLLPNGKVLVAGGQNIGGYLSSAELYDSPPGTVMPVTSMNSAMLPSGAFRFAFTNIPIPGATFTVYSTTNLALPTSNWNALGGAIDDLPGQFHFTELQATNDTLRFYRVRSP